jgi:hypothetical protein
MTTAHETSATRTLLEVVLRINGTEHRLRLDPRTTLLDAFREHLGLTGSEKAVAFANARLQGKILQRRRTRSADLLQAVQGHASGTAHVRERGFGPTGAESLRRSCTLQR